MRKYKLQLGGKIHVDYPSVSDLVPYTIIWISNPETEFTKRCSSYYTPNAVPLTILPEQFTSKPSILPYSSVPHELSKWNLDADPILLPLI